MTAMGGTLDAEVSEGGGSESHCSQKRQVLNHRPEFWSKATRMLRSSSASKNQDPRSGRSDELD